MQPKCEKTAKNYHSQTGRAMPLPSGWCREDPVELHHTPGTQVTGDTGHCIIMFYSLFDLCFYLAFFTVQCSSIQIIFKKISINDQIPHHLLWLSPSVGDNAPVSDRRQKIYGHCYCLLVFT